MKVLIAEASRVVRRLYRTALESDEVLEADGAAGLVDVLSRTRVDLIVAGWDLPGMDGSLLVRLLKKSGGSDLPGLLFVVNPAQEAAAREAVGLGGGDYLVRPFTNDQLRCKVEELAAKDRIRKDQRAASLLRTIAAAAGVESELPFLMRLPSYVIRELLDTPRRSRYEAGAVVVEAGAKVDSLFVVTSGEVQEGAAIHGEGDVFADIAFLTERPAAESVVARTPVEVLSFSLAHLTQVARRHPELQILLRDRAAAAAEPRASREFSGYIRFMPLADIVQMLNRSQATGALVLRSAGRTGEIQFSSGEIRGAREGTAAGEEAFYAILGWEDASFSFKSGAPGPAEGISAPTLSLLMEGLRRLDESRRERV